MAFVKNRRFLLSNLVVVTNVENLETEKCVFEKLNGFLPNNTKFLMKQLYGNN